MMRIEQLKTTPDRAGRYYVHFDNGSVLRLYRQTLEDFSLYSGMELTQEQFEDICRSAEALSAKMRAVRIGLERLQKGTGKQAGPKRGEAQ